MMTDELKALATRIAVLIGAYLADGKKAEAIAWLGVLEHILNGSTRYRVQPK